MSSYTCISQMGCSYFPRCNPLTGCSIANGGINLRYPDPPPTKVITQDLLDAINEDLAEHEVDNVNHPPHYTASSIECIDAIRAALGDELFAGYLRGNIMKYIWRGPRKNGTEDYKKAEFYLKRLIALEEGDKNVNREDS